MKTKEDLIKSIERLDEIRERIFSGETFTQIIRDEKLNYLINQSEAEEKKK
jgi:hypothetical protein